jgi:hypothetical protein
MNCIHCNRTAHAACKFCGRAVCKDHLQQYPYIVSLYSGEDGIHKAIVVPDAVYCGICKPREQPVPLPELK